VERATHHPNLHLKEIMVVMVLAALTQITLEAVAVEQVPLEVTAQITTAVMAALERHHQLLEPQYQGLVVVVVVLTLCLVLEAQEELEAVEMVALLLHHQLREPLIRVVVAVVTKEITTVQQAAPALSSLKYLTT
jgi:methyl coenzyme M reductase beta subunit